MLLSAAWYLLDNAQKKKEIFSRYRFVTVVSILSIQPLWPMPNLTLHKRSVSLEKRWLLTNGNYLPNHNWNPLKCLWNEIFSSFFIGDSGADFRAEHRELICFLPSVLESIYFLPWKWRFLTIRRPPRRAAKVDVWRHWLESHILRYKDGNAKQTRRSK